MNNVLYRLIQDNLEKDIEPAQCSYAIKKNKIVIKLNKVRNSIRMYLYTFLLYIMCIYRGKVNMDLIDGIIYYLRNPKNKRRQIKIKPKIQMRLYRYMLCIYGVYVYVYI